MEYVAPTFQESAFNCPHCQAFAHQEWHAPSFMRRSAVFESDCNFSRCIRCGKVAFWLHSAKQLLYPPLITAPLAHPDMPESLKADFEEARQISGISPRGAAALLRLCIQKLCAELGESGKNVNDDIGGLVRKGLRVPIKQALDVVRVIGNNAVHPGQIDLNDDLGTVTSLFKLVNLIVETMIAEPKRVDEMYAGLPQPQKDQIAKRDGQTP